MENFTRGPKTVTGVLVLGRGGGESISAREKGNTTRGTRSEKVSKEDGGE